MADAAQVSKGVKEEAQGDIESQIKGAMRSRVPHFKQQADSLTFEGVRRLLEKDLGLETFALDGHKRFIKQCLLKSLEGADDDNSSKNSAEAGEKSISSTIEAAESPEGLKSSKGVKEPSSEDEEKMEDSPVLGLLTGNKTMKSETVETQGNENKVPTESSIKKAIRKRAAYIKANSEKVTMAGVRRLLEEDLELDKFTLDPYKKLISEQLDELLTGDKVSKSATEVKKKTLKKSSQSKLSKMVSKEESSDSSDKESEVEEEEEDELKPKKKIVPKGKVQNSEGSKKRKRPAKETKVSSKKQIKPAETMSEDNSDAKDGGNASEDGHSQSSDEKTVKKKEVSTPAYGKRVEHLKSVIKLCGMSVPPYVYKKVKQAPENKREAHLIKELEGILSREGLSSNPSEKEIKEVKRKKERAKELEGIDTSNIVLSSRRRSTNSFVAPQKPKIPVESDGDDAEDKDVKNEEHDADNDDDNDGDGDGDGDGDDDDDDGDDDEDDDDDDDGDDDSPSEEFNDDNDDDSD